jgi:hypothetical protein
VGVREGGRAGVRERGGERERGREGERGSEGEREREGERGRERECLLEATLSSLDKGPRRAGEARRRGEGPRRGEAAAGPWASGDGRVEEVANGDGGGRQA